MRAHYAESFASESMSSCRLSSGHSSVVLMPKTSVRCFLIVAPGTCRSLRLGRSLHRIRSIVRRQVVVFLLHRSWFMLWSGCRYRLRDWCRCGFRRLALLLHRSWFRLRFRLRERIETRHLLCGCHPRAEELAEDVEGRLAQRDLYAYVDLDWFHNLTSLRMCFDFCEFKNACGRRVPGREWRRIRLCVPAVLWLY